MLLKELIEQEEAQEARFQAAIHGVEMDGGSDGSGMDTSYDPTQGKGSDTWQQAQKMALEVNANRRRN